jgi:hypothetical protein
MSVRSIVLAGATLLSLAAPAAAFAQPYWGHDHGGYREGWQGRDGWRRHEWRERERWEHRRYGYGYGYGPRCFMARRGFYNWYGDYVYRPVRVCR